MNNGIILLTSFLLSVVIFVVTVVSTVILHKISYKRKTAYKSLWVLVSGIFVASVIMFFPCYSINYFDASENGFIKVIKSLLLSIHNTMRLFVLDGEFDAIRDVLALVNIDKWLSMSYSVYSVIIFVVAPMLTAGVVLTFFKNVTAYAVYYLNFKSDIYYFTELNEKSLNLAEDVIKTYGKRKKLLVFTNVDFSEDNDELYFRAKALGAVCFNKKEITELSLKKTSGKVLRNIYFISENQTKNVEQALALIKKCKESEVLNGANTRFYVFSVNAESSVLLDNADNEELKVRRVDESRNLIFDIIRNNSVFDGAIESNGVKKINAVIVGAGNHGTKLLKALCWCGQMSGYEIRIHVFDKATDVKDKLEGACPELVKFNGCKTDGEAQYEIVFHEGIDVLGMNFRNELENIGNVTSAYVMLGDDDLNLKIAVRMREVFGRLSLNGKYVVPKTYAIVESPEKNATIRNNGGFKDYTGNLYGIELIGNIEKEYSVKVVEQEELEKKGLKCHLRWSQTGEEIERDIKKFENYEYFRSASIAEALYSELRVNLGIITGKNDANDEILKEYEHRRWNAYMRSEGYVYGKEKNSIAKTHPSLIPYKKLSEKEKHKDKVVLEASEENVNINN